MRRNLLLPLALAAVASAFLIHPGRAAPPFTVAYITPSLAVPFWKWTYDGVAEAAKKVDANVIAYDSKNDGPTQLANAQNAIVRRVDAIIVSPTDSSAVPAVLQAGAAAKVPVVIAFIGTTGGNYVAYLTSTDYLGANQSCSALATALTAHGWPNGPIGEVTNQLARINGRQRTAGCADAMKAARVPIVGQLQFHTDTIAEERGLVQDIANAHPDLHGFFCQSDDCTLAAVNLFKQNGSLNRTVLVSGFDASPATVDCISKGLVLGSSVQRPMTVGKMSFEIAYDFVVRHQPPAKKDLEVSTILVTKDNLAKTASQLIDQAYPASAVAGATCPVE